MATSLYQLAKQINQAFEEAAFYDGEAHQSRIIAGRSLLEANEIWKADNSKEAYGSFQGWCEANIKKANGKPRSWSDIKKVMALARAPDPAAALAAERSARNTSMAKSRIRKAEGSHVGASATKQERSSISAEGTPASHPIPKTLWVVTVRNDADEGHEVFADADAALYWASEYSDLFADISFKITEEPASNFDLKGWIVAAAEDDDGGLMLVRQAHPDWTGGPDHVKGAVPGKIVRNYPAEPAPAPPSQPSTPERSSLSAEGAQPSSPKVTERPAPAQQRDEPPLVTECLALVNAWLANYPPAEHIREVMALIRQKMGTEPPRPNEQPGATLH